MYGRKPSPAMLVAMLSLFIALSGVAWAATSLPKNSVKSKTIKDGQVKSVDVADDDLTGADIKEDTLSGVPQGPAAPTGPAGGDLAGTYPSPTLAPSAVGTGDLAAAAVTIPKLGFDPTTQEELNALASSDTSPPNSGANAVHWDLLNGVPGGFADGSDDTGGTASDVACSLCVDTGDINDGAVDAAKILDGASLSELADDDGAASGLDADLLDGQTANGFWGINGNAGTSASNFIGTTDSQPLQLRSFGSRAVRYERVVLGSGGTAATTMNVLGGAAVNTIGTGVGGATIAGGGSSTLFLGNSPNSVTDNYGTVAGGLSNQAGDATGTAADHPSATVGGGADNDATGARSTVPGGRGNKAHGAESFAAGEFAVVAAAHNGTFLWSDASGFNFDSAAANEFAVRSTGGARFVSAINGSGTPTAGVQLAPGGGSWSALSDEASKTAVEPISGEEVLSRLDQVPVSEWSYVAQGTDVRHIGPMAQDFADAFGVGEDERHITTVDADGVALAAIKGLNQKIEALEAGAVPTAPLAAADSRPPALAVVVGALLALVVAAVLGAAVALRWSGRVLRAPATG